MTRTLTVAATMAAMLLGVACGPPPADPAAPAVFARAYADLDGTNGYQAGVDVLVAELVDANGDGSVSVGDQVELDQYPTDLDATSFGSFGVAVGQVTSVSVSTTQITAVTALGSVVFSDHPGAAEYLVLQGATSGNSTFQDSLQTTSSDLIVVQPTSPFAPDTAVPLTVRADSTDNRFVDIDIDIM